MYDVRITNMRGFNLIEQWYQLILHFRSHVNFVGRMINIICRWRMSLITYINIVGESNFIFEPEAQWISMFEVASIKGVIYFATEGTNFGVEWILALKTWFTMTFSLFMRKYAISLRIIWVFHKNLGGFRSDWRG